MRFQFHPPLRTLTALLTLGFLASTAIAAGANAEAIAAVRPVSPLPPHPRLLLNADGVAQLQQRIATQPWAKESWGKLKAAADNDLARPVELPPRGGNWSHNYVCPTHGARLKPGQKIGPWQWEHICPVGPHTLHGDPSKAALDFDGNAIAAAHGRLAREIVDHGLAFQVTGDARHAAKAREILLAYADHYLAYPMHDNQGRPRRGGHVASQSLTEASWLTTFTQGADLVWTSLNETDRAAIADRVLLPALKETILPRRMGIHNIQCHHNSAIGLVGFLLGDDKLIATAIDDPANGHRQQMEKGVLGDGMWTEGSSGYHFFTIAGVWPLTEAARNCGRDLYGPKFQSMFDGPLALATPDFVLPDFNDSGTVPLASQADYYELALARYKKTIYTPLLAQSNRRGELAMLFGVALPPADAPQAALGSRNSPASGYAILQSGQGVGATWLCLKYGPHGGGHGHFDKNNFILYSRGRIVAPDAGTHAYGSPLHGTWDKLPLAHNTLTVDEATQAAATGKCLAFGNERGASYVMSDAGPIYPGVRFVRTVAMLTSNLMVFVDQVTADKPHTLDLVYHQNGTWGELPAGGAWATPKAVGYQYFTGTTQRTNDTPGLTLPLNIANGWRSTVALAEGEPTEVITGYGILKTTEDRVPMLVQRRRGEKTAFVWAVSLGGTPVTLKTEAVANETGMLLSKDEAVLASVSAGGQNWSLLVNPQKLSVMVKRPDGTRWRTDAAFAQP
ncbi:MAG: heparinase II/III family protein [Verrucomicrobiota bacterium]